MTGIEISLLVSNVHYGKRILLRKSGSTFGFTFSGSRAPDREKDIREIIRFVKPRKTASNWDAGFALHVDLSR